MSSWRSSHNVVRTRKSMAAGWLLHAAVFCLWLTTQTATGQDCPPCPELQSTFSSRIQRFFNYDCINEQATYQAEVICRRGFQQMVTAYNSTCTCNRDICQWQPEGSCQIEPLSLILCGIALFAVSIIFILLFVLVCKCYGD